MTKRISWTMAFLLQYALFQILLGTSAYSHPHDDGERVDDDSVVSVLVTDVNGMVMVESSLSFKPDWTSVSIAEPLTMEHYLPLSLRQDEPDNLVCVGVDPEVEAAMSNYQVLLKHPQATTVCPFPSHPSGQLYSCITDDGGIVLLRIQPGYEAAELIAAVGDSRYEFQSISPYDYAKLQVVGSPHETDISKQVIEFRVAEQDCLSLIAFTDQQGRREQLINATGLTAELIDLFHELNGFFPRTLCQLYTGPDRVIAAIPRNPYAWEQNLCGSEDALPRPTGAVDYVPQIIDEEVVGYWLAA